ncbi:MAG: hypothetical protein VX223_10800, partial [Myxococcota bacterium]|nr:hypothetical protein [Myxococcota bacterium]
MSAKPQVGLQEVTKPPRRLAHASAMVERPGLLLRFMGRFFDKVHLRAEDAERLLDAESDGPVVLVLERHSLIDFLYLNWVFWKRDLPLVVWSPSVRTWPYRALSGLFLRIRRRVGGERPLKGGAAVLHALQQNEPILLFARQKKRRSRTFGFYKRPDPVLHVLKAREQLSREVRFVPVVIAWERVPVQLRRGFWDRFFGSHDAPGRLRELLNFMGNHAHALVRVGEPLELGSMIPEDCPQGQGVSKIRYALNRYFINENRVIRGPIGKTASQTISEMMRPEGFGRHLPALAEQLGEPLPEVQRKAQRYLEEIVADMRPAWIEAARMFLSFVFNKLYAGVEVRGIQTVLDASREAPLVVIPSHKS